MKTLSRSIIILFSVFASLTAMAQTKTETFAVSGECNMCKKKIETAAKTAGATYAVWNVTSKKITIKYNESSATAKIKQSIADAGYDTPDVKASDAAYDSLHDCCKYDRTAKAESCCTNADCCKDGTCKKDAACCTEKSCCADGTCEHKTAAHSHE